MSLTIKSISGADLRAAFHKTSLAWGYSPAKQAALMADIAALIFKWRTDLTVEIYTLKHEYRYGRIKSSRFNAAGQESKHYATYFHTRAKAAANDPLLIVTFDPVAGQDDLLLIEAIIDHKCYFGAPGAGKSKAQVERRSSDVKRRIEQGKKVVPLRPPSAPKSDNPDDIPPEE